MRGLGDAVPVPSASASGSFAPACRWSNSPAPPAPSPPSATRASPSWRRWPPNSAWARRSPPGMSAATRWPKTVSFLGLVCGSLAKIATDIILLAQTEVGEVAEPYVAGRGQSSTMPQKRNPIASEYILAAARMVQGLVPVMLGAMAQDHERATGPWQAEALALPQAFVLTHGALLHTRCHCRGHGGGCRADAGQPRPHPRPDRFRSSDDGPRAGARPRRGAPCRQARLRRGADREDLAGRRACSATRPWRAGWTVPRSSG